MTSSRGCDWRPRRALGLPSSSSSSFSNLYFHLFVSTSPHGPHGTSRICMMTHNKPRKQNKKTADGLPMESQRKTNGNPMDGPSCTQGIIFPTESGHAFRGFAIRMIPRISRVSFWGISFLYSSTCCNQIIWGRPRTCITGKRNRNFCFSFLRYPVCIAERRRRCTLFFQAGLLRESRRSAV